MNVEEVMYESFNKSRKMHADSIAKEYKRKKDIKMEDEKRLIEKEMFRQNRRELREKRRKEVELAKLKEEIKTLIVDKGESRDHISQIDPLDIHGNYERGRPYLGVLGGHMM